MYQPTFADLEYEGKKLKTRREKFLERMDGLIPWEQLEERVRPFYPKAWPSGTACAAAPTKTLSCAQRRCFGYTGRASYVVLGPLGQSLE